MCIYMYCIYIYIYIYIYIVCILILGDYIPIFGARSRVLRWQSHVVPTDD